MDPKKITYTVSWTQDPGSWDIPNTVKLLEQARSKAVEAQSQLIEQQLANGNFALANDLIHKIKAK
jgi:hypothetical protein